MRLTLVAVALAFSATAAAQLNSLTREELTKYTAKNPYERFPDGRPKVPDALLKELADFSSEDLMGASGPNHTQFADGFRLLNPGKKLVGRALTVQMMPLRPEVAEVDAAEWKAKGHERVLNHQSAIDLLQPGDVLVIDAFGHVEGGGIIGNNLAYYVWKKTGTGFVIDGAIRDLEENSRIGAAGYFRAATPPAVHGFMVTGINIPVRIGKTTVLPGDVVVGDRQGVTFIPPHLAQQLVDNAKIVALKDAWTQSKFDEGKYVSSDVYGMPRTPELIKEYDEYLKSKLTPEAYEAYKKRRAGGGRR